MRLVTITAIAILATATANAETYRLIHAIGNSEREIVRDIPKGECERLKREHIAVAEALGIYNERLGIGSIACLPESLFND